MNGSGNAIYANSGGNGNKATTELPVPQFDGLPREGCAPLTVDFRDLSEFSDGRITGWFWDFGDGNTSVSQHPQHIYANPGVYTVRLRIVTSTGKDSTITKQSFIASRLVPRAGFIANPVIAFKSAGTVRFTNTTTNLSPGIQWYWRFNDPGAAGKDHSELKDPEYRFRDTGTYWVVLVAINEYDCRDSNIQQIKIIPDDTVNKRIVGVYPNPSLGAMRVRLNNINDNIILYRLINGDGREVTRKDRISQNEVEIPYPGQGIYMIEIKTDKGNAIRQKVIFN